VGVNHDAVMVAWESVDKPIGPPFRMALLDLVYTRLVLTVGVNKVPSVRKEDFIGTISSWSLVGVNIHNDAVYPGGHSRRKPKDTFSASNF
jgi:hypothetical protein